MYFIDRVALGHKLADSLSDLRGQEAVIICLKNSSILTCLSMAMKLQAWVYLLPYAPVYSDDRTRRLLGAFDEAGDFLPVDEKHGDQSDIQMTVTNQKDAAMKQIQEQLESYELPMNKAILNGRHVVLVADVMKDTMPLMMAIHYLRSVQPKSLNIAIGNATASAADLAHVSAGRSVILDVLSGVTLDDNRYYEHPDPYTDEQKRLLTQNIVAYWQ